MTTNFSHTNCTHPKTPAARSACRKAIKKGTTVLTFGSTVVPPVDLVAAPEVDVITDVYDSTMISTLEHMGRADAVRITEDLFKAYGLVGWHVHFDNARRRAGACSYARRQIRLSAPLMAQRSYADTHSTITHEIAHALTPGHNHDATWSAMHRTLGGDGKRCFEHVDEDAPFIARCDCGQTYTKYRAPRTGAQYRCRKCRSSVVFVPNN